MGEGGRERERKGKRERGGGEEGRRGGGGRKEEGECSLEVVGYP